MLDLGVGLTGENGVYCPTCCVGLERSLVEFSLLGSTRTDPSAKFDVAILSAYGEEASGGAGEGRGDGESGDG